MVALKCSPESVSPQIEFYLLYYYCSNLRPPGWGQFWPQGYHMNRIDKGPNIIVQVQMIKALLLLVSEKKNFKVFLLCSYVSNLWPPGWGPVWPQGHHMNNLGRGPQGDATYKISKLYAFYFKRRKILKFSFFVPMFQSCESPHPRSTRRCYIPNIKALHFLVSEKRNFEVFLLCSYVLNLWLPGRGQFWP